MKNTKQHKNRLTKNIVQLFFYCVQKNGTSFTMIIGEGIKARAYKKCTLFFISKIEFYNYAIVYKWETEINCPTFLSVPLFTL